MRAEPIELPGGFDAAVERVAEFWRYFIDGVESWAMVAPEVEEDYRFKAQGMVLAALGADEETLMTYEPKQSQSGDSR